MNAIFRTILFTTALLSVPLSAYSADEDSGRLSIHEAQYIAIVPHIATGAFGQVTPDPGGDRHYGIHISFGQAGRHVWGQQLTRLEQETLSGIRFRIMSGGIAEGILSRKGRLRFKMIAVPNPDWSGDPAELDFFPTYEFKGKVLDGGKRLRLRLPVRGEREKGFVFERINSQGGMGAIGGIYYGNSNDFDYLPIDPLHLHSSAEIAIIPHTKNRATIGVIAAIDTQGGFASRIFQNVEITQLRKNLFKVDAQSPDGEQIHLIIDDGRLRGSMTVNLAGSGLAAAQTMNIELFANYFGGLQRAKPEIRFVATSVEADAPGDYRSDVRFWFQSRTANGMLFGAMGSAYRNGEPIPLFYFIGIDSARPFKQYISWPMIGIQAGDTITLRIMNPNGRFDEKTVVIEELPR